MNNKNIIAVLSVIFGLIFGIGAGLLAGFGLIANYYYSLIYIMVVSALIFLGYAFKAPGHDRQSHGECTSAAFGLAGVSVVISALGVALVSGVIATTSYIGLVYGITFGVFAAAIFALLFTKSK